MKFGVCLPHYGQTFTLSSVRKIAIESERLGYDSIWVTDHILFQPMVGEPYHRIFESLTTLAYLASVTKHVKLGISSLILPMRNPIIATKQLATIDVLSGGRLIVAVAAGWNEKEFSELGSNFHGRGRRLDESIQLLRALWEGKPDFRAEYIVQHFQNASLEPRPIQKKLTVLIGGNSPAAMKRAVRFGDGWHPTGYDPDVASGLVEQFRAQPGSEVKEICFRIERNAKSPEAKPWLGKRNQPLISGDRNEDARIVQGFTKLGIPRLLLCPASDGNVPVQFQLKQLREFAHEFIINKH